MVLLCIKQHLSNIWSSIHKKGKQHWGWVEKTRCLEKKREFWEWQFHYLLIVTVSSDCFWELLSLLFKISGLTPDGVLIS